ncbi:uncharacterized protein (TIGR02453 family) [Flavobacterium gossypii]|uniref:Uncharacterized protein (TIGR02453 family) n=2 Tax=Flavobacterium TaxID=237 RepID=A0A495MHU8_9FLAO|nr:MULTISPECIES: DUF2461 domain-containing protein [Flavobacterium]MBA9072524.1 uncharacterized protein (TIGR02453 family) [Flavobacterium gossypii]RKS25557.1 uncharacterized protein (TIGR02453 family) [Flavobacterium endophyticum]WDO12996.1 DUF2461 domain-containing protein [Flavobacterium sp. WW92]
MLSPKTLQFLEDLKENNNREWFLANKSYYEEYKKEYHQLISDFLEEMVPFDDSLRNLEPKKCAFRINRDIRFSKDKSPYKTHMGIWMTTDQNRSNSPGYYVHIEKGGSFIAVGLHVPEAADLKKVRKEIAYFYEDLEEIVNDKDFKKIYPELDRTEANSLKTAPKDYEKDHPAIEFLKLKSFTVSQKLDDKSLFEKDFVKKTAKKLITAKPLNDFLTRGLNTE